MLRRIPSTLLVCIAIYLTTICLNSAWAADPNKSLEILLKPNQTTAAPAPTVQKAKSTGKPRAVAVNPYDPYLLPPPVGIAKVKPVGYKPWVGPLPCILPAPKMRQWELGAQAFFARTKGTLAWPRYTPYWNWAQGWSNETDFSGGFKLPEHNVWVDLSARYQFRPNWAVRYEVLFDELNGGGYVDQPFVFGPWWAGYVYYGQQINSKWQHAYHRVSLV
ncbi:MAG: hypothetical protein FJY85_11585, partial [Deltaproteobacteria bacterium]|nr:hypothetical protein [Deltaproteobacteria bacterium]